MPSWYLPAPDDNGVGGASSSPHLSGDLLHFHAGTMMIRATDDAHDNRLVLTLLTGLKWESDVAR